jgi:hypothetical protein
MSPAEQLNPAYWTAERVERMKRTSTRTYRMHVQNLFGGASNCFDYDAIERAFRALPASVRSAGRPIGIIDASSGKKDTWSYGVCQWARATASEDAYLRETAPGLPEGVLVLDANDRPIIRPDHVAARPVLYFPVIDGFEGAFWAQLPGDEVVRRVSELFHRSGVVDVHGDQRESYMLEAEFRRNGLRFHEHAYTGGSDGTKAAAVERVRRWLATETVIFHPHARMRAEFHGFIEKPTPGGGFTFGARGSGHDDFVCLALTAALADIHGDLRRSPLGGGRERTGAPHESLG